MTLRRTLYHSVALRNSRSSTSEVWLSMSRSQWLCHCRATIFTVFPSDCELNSIWVLRVDDLTVVSLSPNLRVRKYAHNTWYDIHEKTWHCLVVRRTKLRTQHLIWYTRFDIIWHDRTLSGAGMDKVRAQHLIWFAWHNMIWHDMKCFDAGIDTSMRTAHNINWHFKEVWLAQERAHHLICQDAGCIVRPVREHMYCTSPVMIVMIWHDIVWW